MTRSFGPRESGPLGAHAARDFEGRNAIHTLRKRRTLLRPIWMGQRSLMVEHHAQVAVVYPRATISPSVTHEFARYWRELSAWCIGGSKWFRWITFDKVCWRE